MGAFQAYQWGLAYPDLVERIAPCCGAARVSPHCYVFLEGAKAALTADQKLEGGDYAAPPETGLRAMGRVWAGWAVSQQFYRDGLYRRMGFDDVETFLVDFWEAFWLKLDANNLLSQLHTWQTADISKSPGYDGDLERALKAIRAKAVLSPGEKDLYFPPEDMAWEARCMPDAELRVDPRTMGPFLRGRHRRVVQRVPRQFHPHAAGTLTLRTAAEIHRDVDHPSSGIASSSDRR